MGLLRFFARLALGVTVACVGALASRWLVSWLDHKAAEAEGAVVVDTTAWPSEPEPEPATRAPQEPVVAERPARRGHCCVVRGQLDEMQTDAVVRELDKRWPMLRRLGITEIGEGDRVGFLVEVGSRPVTFARELLIGQVTTADVDELVVRLDCSPREQERHGLAHDALTTIPRDAVIGWARAGDPETDAELDGFETRSFARFVRSGDPIDVVAQHVPHTRWRVVPEGFAEVDVLEHHDDQARVVLHSARTGRVDLEIAGGYAESHNYLLGRWPIVILPGVA